MPALPPTLRPLLIFGLLALLTVALGCWVCALSDVSTASWVRNLIAWGVGLAAAGGLAATGGRRPGLILLGLAVVVLGGSLVGVPQQGVNRWLDIGPLHINVAFVVLPMAVVALAWNRDRLSAWGLALAGLALLVVQPDASQATAFGLALVVVAVRAPVTVGLRIGTIAIATALVVASWLRPDPLAPVPEVEEIVGLAYAVMPLLAVLAVALIATTALVPALVTRSSRPDIRIGGAALSVYCLATVGTTVFGAFPMPLLGIGMSPILGFWLGVGLLAAWIRRESRPAANPASGS
tara:strand:+ start:2530 stop:3411 length:882 start_codon:yes stop_codon:yes gene_type:complete